MQGDMKKIFQMAQAMQEKLQTAQEELRTLQFEGDAAGSGVKIVLTGEGDVVRVIIPKEAVDPEDIGLLEDLILVAFQNAQQKQRQVVQERLAKSTGMPLSHFPFL